MIIGFVIGAVIGFVAGILVGRKNKEGVEKVVAAAKTEATAIENSVKK
jgi:hypothetical protein